MNSDLPALKFAQLMAHLGAGFCIALLLFGLPYSGRLRKAHAEPSNSEAARWIRFLYGFVAAAGWAVAGCWLVAAAGIALLYFRGW